MRVTLTSPTEREWPPPDGRDDGPPAPSRVGPLVPHKPVVVQGRRLAMGVLFASGEFPMQDFVERTNIENFRKRLETENDLTKRSLLVNLLAEEEAKHADHRKETK